MKRAEKYLEEININPKYLNIGDLVLNCIKQAQIDAIEEAVKRCYDEFELFEVDGVAVGIDYNSSVKVAEQLRKEIDND